jgi:hypothetical protein
VGSIAYKDLLAPQVNLSVEAPLHIQVNAESQLCAAVGGSSGSPGSPPLVELDNSVKDNTKPNDFAKPKRRLAGEDGLNSGLGPTLIDELAVYSRVLSASELRAVYLGHAQPKCSQFLHKVL